jgi:hypothetical protein
MALAQRLPSRAEEYAMRNGKMKAFKRQVRVLAATEQAKVCMRIADAFEDQFLGALDDDLPAQLDAADAAIKSHEDEIKCLEVELGDPKLHLFAQALLPGARGKLLMAKCRKRRLLRKVERVQYLMDASMRWTDNRNVTAPSQGKVIRYTVEIPARG